VDHRLRVLDEARVVERIWARDPTVWKPDPNTPEVADRLGWLTVAERLRGEAGGLGAFAEQVRGRFQRIVLCGMGGSSLAPEVYRQLLGRRAAARLTLLDTTEPATVLDIGQGRGLRDTLFLVSSKSGTTQETSSLFQYFWSVTGGSAGQFVAITDPGTPLATLGASRGFLRVFLNPEDIGGRYSALSLFGLVPAALVGHEVEGVLSSGERMSAACRPGEAARYNAGAWLGAVLGEAWRAGRDKLTLFLSPALLSFGLWVEQLVAESSGKEGKGLVPVVEASPGPPDVYGRDRLFVSLRLAGDANPRRDEALERLERAGHPVLRITGESAQSIGAEFFRWEFATAVACAVLGVNAFDQPNVAESKENTKALLARGVRLSPAATESELRLFFRGVETGDYLALLAYLPPSTSCDRGLARLAHALRDRLHVAVTSGYGPRYLHSTGQLHKGGPPHGHFVVIAQEPTTHGEIPGEPFSFGALFMAQAEGDVQALRRRRRPVVRVESLEALEGALRG
jgi:glucose-6-phosphate isomerase